MLYIKIAIREAIQNIANVLDPEVKVYYENSSDQAAFPYIVFDFDQINTPDEAGDSFVLDIDGYDAPSNGDDTRLDTLMYNLDGNGDLINPTGLNQKIVETNQLYATLNRVDRQPIPEPDKTIKRRRYSYQVSVFEKEEVS